MAAHAIPSLSPAEYLALERAAELRSEYHDGQMFAMSGGSLAHAMLPGGMGFALRHALRGRDCIVLGADMRLQVTAEGPYFYPDLTVVCGEPKLADDYKDTLMNPLAIFEVPSQSSEAYDRGWKFAQYRRIESLREYVLISQTEPRIEVFTKQPDGSWNLTEAAGLNAVCRLPGLQCSVALADVYEGVVSRS